MSKIVPGRPKWRGTMTDRERFNRQLHFKPVDRCFNMEFGFWDDLYTQWPMFVENGITDHAKAVEFLGFDKWHWWIGGGVGFMVPGFPQEVVRETATTKVIQDSYGVLAEVPKDGHYTIPHYIKPTVVTPEDWKRVKEERFNPDDPRRRHDVAALKKRFPPTRDYPISFEAGSMIGKIRDMLTFEGLAYAVYDYPEMVEDMVETCCVLVERSLDQLAGQINFDVAAGWEDICFKNGPIVSVDFFNKVVVPRYKRISSKLRAHGVDIFWIDCDGDVRHLLPGFLEGGVNILYPFEVNGCCHPGELLRQYEGELRIMGGVDKMVLARGKPEIKAYMESLVPLVERGGFIPFCDHNVPPDVSQENYLYFLDLKERMFGMKA